MNYWLVKSEPEEYGWDHIVKDKVATWDGVRNYQARNSLKEMKKGDLVFIYHSGKTRDIVGICTVELEHFPDPKAPEKEGWVAIKLKPYQKLNEPVTLDQMKADEKITDIKLLRNPRLSVMPVIKKEFDHILKLSQTKLKA